MQKMRLSSEEYDAIETEVKLEEQKDKDPANMDKELKVDELEEQKDKDPANTDQKSKVDELLYPPLLAVQLPELQGEIQDITTSLRFHRVPHETILWAYDKVAEKVGDMMSLFNVEE
ncbi:hypothetical protein PQX77_016271 [Marasmius sp. AFHP31]|nr:hypothetical protein PQX77_016271 [Marasmius sp. AFHP31]